MPDDLIVAPDCEPCQIGHDCEADPDECWHEPKWWTCAYYQTVDKTGVQTQPCSFGCYDEPNCVTGQPSEGWPEGGDRA